MDFINKWKERSGVLRRCMRHPRIAYQLLQNGLSSRDQIFLEQLQWTYGDLPRVPLENIVAAASVPDLRLIGPLDRARHTSITLYELCCLLAMAAHVKARRILEIGTWDGNTALNLAANTEAHVVTVDLPPYYDAKTRFGFPAADVNNMTPRDQLGRQLRQHPVSSRIEQVFGDSARLDWQTFGPPFDLIFIDGCHKYSYVLADSKNARSCIARGGAIVWHDYGIFRDVSLAVDTIAASGDLVVHAVEGTRLAVAFDAMTSRG